MAARKYSEERVREIIASLLNENRQQTEELIFSSAGGLVLFGMLVGIVMSYCSLPSIGIGAALGYLASRHRSEVAPILFERGIRMVSCCSMIFGEIEEKNE